MLPPLRSFLATLREVEDVETVVARRVVELDSMEEAFVREAKRLYPGVPTEVHRRAAEIVHRKIHERMDRTEQLLRAGVPEEGMQAFAITWAEDLRAKLAIVRGDEYDFQRYAPVWNRARVKRPMGQILRNSLLTAAVSGFEVLVSGLVRAFLALKPEVLRQSDRKYLYSEVELFTTLDEFRDHCAEVTADNLLRGGFDEWMEWFSRRHKLAITGVTDSATELREIFQRRHLLVHNGGVVNRYYLSKLGEVDDPPDLGDKLWVTPDYLAKALDELTVAGVKLAASLLLKIASNEQDREIVHDELRHIAYELLCAERWSTSARLDEWHLSFLVDDSWRLVARVNLWVAQKRMWGVEYVRQDVECWNTETLASKYLLAKLALLDRNEDAYELVKRLILSNEINSDNWTNWPVLEGVRQYESEEISVSDWVAPAPFGDAHSDVSDSVADSNL